MIKVAKTKGGSHTRDECIKRFKEWWSDPSELRNVLQNCMPSGNNVFSLIGGLDSTDSEQINNPNKLAEILFDVIGPNFIYSIHGDSNYERTRDFRERAVNAAIKRKQFTKQKIISIAQQSRSNLQNCSSIEDICYYNYKEWLEDLTKWLGLPPTTCQKPKTSQRPDKTETIEANVDYKPLYDYQYTAGLKIRNMLEGIDEQKRLLLSIPTGAGKTRLVVEALIDWLNTGRENSPAQQQNSKYMIWIAQSHELCEQAIDAFKTLYKIKGKTALNLHRFFGAGGAPPDFDLSEFLDSNGLIVATIHSFDKLIPKNTEDDAQDIANDDEEEALDFGDDNPLLKLAKLTSCIVIDEAHRSTSKMYTRFLRAMGFNFHRLAKIPNENNIILIGLTATPFRGTGVDFEGNSSEFNIQTKRLHNRFGGEPYYPEIYESTDEEKQKPVAIIDCPHLAHTNEYVRISGDYSFDNESVIKEYSWRITYLPPMSEIYNNPKPLPNPKPEKIVSYKFENSGEYKISLTVINNENLSHSVEKFIKILPEENINKITGTDKQKLLYKRLIKRKILCEVYRGNIKGVTTTLNKEDSAEYVKKQEYQKQTLDALGKNFNRNKLIIDVILELRKYGKKKILVFACNIEHARLLAIALRAKSLNAEFIDSKVDTGRRIELISKFKQDTDDINILCNVDILTTGFDSPNIDCVFVTRPAKSTVLYTQMIGRGMRGTRGGGTPDMWLINMDDNIQLYYTFDKKTEFGWKVFEDSWKSLHELGVTLPEMTGIPETLQSETEFSEKTEMEQFVDEMENYLPKEHAYKTNNPQILSLSCIDCQYTAEGIEEIQNIFGIEGDPKILADHIETNNFSDIPKKCYNCRQKEKPVEQSITTNSCPYVSYLENQNNIHGNYQMVLGLYLADCQQLNKIPDLFDARKFLVRHNPSKTLSDIPSNHAVFDVYKKRGLIKEISNNEKIIYEPILELDKFRDLCIKKIEDYEESLKQLVPENEIIIPKEELELANKLDEHYNILKSRIIGHIPTSRQFEKFTDDNLIKIMNSLYGDYSSFLNSKNEDITEDQNLKDKLYDEYFELYHSVHRNISKEELDDYGNYTTSDYVESFGSYDEFKSIFEAISTTVSSLKKPQNEAEYIGLEKRIKNDYVEIKDSLGHVPHFEEFHKKSKLGIEYCLMRYGSFGRFKKIFDMPENDQNTITHLQEEYHKIKKLLKMPPTFTQMLKHCRTSFKIMDLFDGKYSNFIEFIGDSENSQQEPSADFKKSNMQQLINKTLNDIEQYGREKAIVLLLNAESIPYDEWFGSKDTFMIHLDKEDPWINDKYKKIKEGKKPKPTFSKNNFLNNVPHFKTQLKKLLKSDLKNKCPKCNNSLIHYEGSVICPNKLCTYYE